MIKIDFKLISGIILVKARANDIDGFFAFDTGAMATALNQAYFSNISGEEVNIAKFSEEVKECSANKSTLGTLKISAMELTNLPVIVMDLMYVENALKTVMPELKLLGTLGIDVIGSHSVLIDYASSTLILDTQIEFEKSIIVPMVLDVLPIIKVDIMGEEQDFVLDTGANTCLLDKKFLNEPWLESVSETQNIVKIPEISVGGRKYSEITAVISDISAIQKKVPANGVIGYQILSEQRAVLDFMSKRLVLECLGG